MATVRPRRRRTEIDYPDSDGRPMGETPDHRDNLAYLVEMLRTWYAENDRVYVSGNMFIYYQPGDRLKHVSPDVFVVKGIPRDVTPRRRRYLTWEEGKNPDLVIELTSPSTREEDKDDKYQIYQATLRVREFFLFDPHHEYLDPPLQGYRLYRGRYRPIQPVDGRLPSDVLGLHLEGQDWLLRLYDPDTGKWLLTPPEEREALRQAEGARRQAEQARQQAEAEAERLRQELEALRKRLPKQP